MGERWSEADVRITANGTLVISLDTGDDLDKIWRVMAEHGMWCRMFYEEAPTIEPKKGRWSRPSRPKTYERICSVCGKKCWYCGAGDYDYCPWCGADMKGDADVRTAEPVGQE